MALPAWPLMKGRRCVASDVAGPATRVILDRERGYRRLDPVPDPLETQAFYESRYRDVLGDGERAPDLARLLAGGADAERERTWLAATVHADVIDALERNVPAAAGRRVLDIGAGTGDLVAGLIGAGWDAEGTEPAPEIAAAGRARGLPIASATASEYLALSDAQGGRRYAAVTMMNVLEHIPEPGQLLRLVRGALAPRGVLIVRVPNDFNPLQVAAARCLSLEPWWITIPDHVNYFDHETLATLLEAHDFAVLERTADYPMELFLLQGDVYVTDPGVGRACHERRRRIELALPADVRRSLGRALVSAGIGRNAMAVARAEP